MCALTILHLTKADVEDELILRILSLAYVHNFLSYLLVLVIVFDDEQRRVERQPTTKAFGVQPGEFFARAREKNARPIVFDASGHATLNRLIKLDHSFTIIYINWNQISKRERFQLISI